MKVSLEKDYRELYSLNTLQAAKRVIAAEKEDECSASEMAEYAVREALKGSGDYLREIIKAEARTARNNRVWNAYGDDTQNMDVWVSAIAKTSAGYMEVSAYLSDIWQTGAIEYKDKMYVVTYTKKAFNI